MRRIIIIGAGPGGICAARQLKEYGYENFVILEQAPQVGGTWWHNAYPGCRCDVPSHFYSFSFAQKLDWSEPYATRSEILDYLQQCVADFGLQSHLRLNTRVEAAQWDEDTACWSVHTANGEVLTADVMISAVGLFNVPAYPDIAGLELFEGPTMHAARWNHAIDLAGKTVSVIGSAASAVQLVPEIAKIVGHLYVHQRTPNYVGPRDNTFSEEFIEHSKVDAAAAAAAERARIGAWLDLICPLDNPAVIAQTIEACARNLEQVEDPETRRRLTPDYPFGSKRGLVSSDWYPTFNRDNVTLVTEAITRITPNGIVTADGGERDTDVIVFATGFETTRFLSAIPIRGRNATLLHEAWSEGARAYLGITTPQFPNLFMLYGPNTNNGSIIFQLECQVDYILRKLQMMDRRQLQWIDIRPSALHEYNTMLQRDLAKVDVWQAGVRDYYRADSGLIVTQWPHSMERYRLETSRADDDAYECA